MNAYGAELYLQGSLPSTFSFFIINYFSLIARIKKKREQERAFWVSGASHYESVSVPVCGVYTSGSHIKKNNKKKKHKLDILGQQCSYS